MHDEFVANGPKISELDLPAATTKSLPQSVIAGEPRGDLARRSAVVEASTTAGSFLATVSLDGNAGQHFVDLVQSGFYDGLFFHRLAGSSFIQGGDPHGTGEADPQYYFGDPSPADLRSGFVRGSLAMVSAPEGGGLTPQFFICLADVRGLDNQHVLIGTLDPDSEWLQRVAKWNVVVSQVPQPPIKIENIVVFDE